MAEILKNQIAMAMFVLMLVVAGACWVLEGAIAKDVLTQVIIAVGALVTGQQREKSKVQRALDKIEEVQADAKVEVVKAEVAKAVQVAKENDTPAIAPDKKAVK